MLFDHMQKKKSIASNWDLIDKIKQSHFIACLWNLVFLLSFFIGICWWYWSYYVLTKKVMYINVFNWIWITKDEEDECCKFIIILWFLKEDERNNKIIKTLLFSMQISQQENFNGLNSLRNALHILSVFISTFFYFTKYNNSHLCHKSSYKLIKTETRIVPLFSTQYKLNKQSNGVSIRNVSNFDYKASTTAVGQLSSVVCLFNIATHEALCVRENNNYWYGRAE